MKDSIKIVLAIILIVVAGLLMRTSLIKYIQKSNISAQDSLGIVMITLNILMLFFMVQTILENNRSSMAQIKAIDVSTTKQIEAIKTVTQNHINALEEFERKSKDALLSALILEYKENVHQMQYILEQEKIWIDPKNTDAPMSIFSCEAYQANLNKGTIDDADWIDVLVRVYTSFKLYQSYVDAVKININSGNITAKVANLNTLMKHIRHNLNDTIRFQKEMLNYKNAHYKKT